MIEYVRGTIVGTYYKRYEFWTVQDPRCFAKGNFVDDAEAEEWFEKNYPDEYKFGVEMRCWD